MMIIPAVFVGKNFCPNSVSYIKRILYKRGKNSTKYQHYKSEDQTAHYYCIIFNTKKTSGDFDGKSLQWEKSVSHF